MNYLYDRIEQYPSGLPILSPHRDFTDACRARLERDVLPVYHEESVEQQLHQHVSRFGWQEGFAALKRLWSLGAAQEFPDTPGIFCITPELDADWYRAAHAWRCADDSNRIIIDTKTHAHYAPLIEFDAVEDEVAFLLKSPQSFWFTKNSMLRQRIRWLRGKSTAFAEWRFSSAQLFSMDNLDLSFEEKLEKLAPERASSVYRNMQWLAERCAPGEFVPVLRELLHLLEYDCEVLYTTAMLSRSLIVCGLDEGDWPSAGSIGAAQLKYLLSGSACVVTKTKNGYGSHGRLHMWSTLCTQQVDTNKSTDVSGQTANCDANKDDREITSYDDDKDNDNEQASLNNDVREKISQLRKFLPTRIAVHGLYCFKHEQEKFYHKYLLRLKNQSGLYAQVIAALSGAVVEVSQDARRVAYQMNKRINEIYSEYPPISDIEYGVSCTARYNGLDVEYKLHQFYSSSACKVAICYAFGSYDLGSWIAWCMSLNTGMRTKVISCSARKHKECKPSRSASSIADEYIHIRTT